MFVESRRLAHFLTRPAIAIAVGLMLSGHRTVCLAQTATPFPGPTPGISSAQALPVQVAPPLTVSTPQTDETKVTVPEALRAIFESGAEPTTLTQLKLLERQNQRVAERAKRCTVSVQLGASQGCGVIVSDTGYVFTAAHVAMRPNKRAQITLHNGRVVWAKTLGMDKNVDAGLLKIDPGQNGGRPWEHATLGSSKKLVPGMWVVATGHPGGYKPARGTVSRIGRILLVRPDAIETDCALIGGDSGGPLFDISGRLIAVHSRIGNDVAENLHVPIDHYNRSWDRMRAGESFGFLPGFRPVLGVQGEDNPDAAIVKKVHPGSPAQRAEIRPGDQIRQFGEFSITDFSSLKHAVEQTMPGERVRMWISREGKNFGVVITIGRAE